MRVAFYGYLKSEFIPALIQLPQVFVDSDYATAEDTLTGVIKQVGPGKAFTTVQAAIDAADPGDEIVIDAGVSFDQPSNGLVLKAKTQVGAPKWIIIRSSGTTDAAFPAEGVTAIPADNTLMPKILSTDNQPAIRTETGASGGNVAYYRLVGLEVSVKASTIADAPGGATHFGCIKIGDGNETNVNNLPHHIIIDRCHPHGLPTKNTGWGVRMDGAHLAIVDSTVDDCHVVGQETQAILAINSPGPLKIVHNRLEGAGENMMIGGGDPDVVGLIPSDIEIRGNHFFKPLSWWTSHGTYAGFHWSVKNLFELKLGNRVLIEGNVFENCWLDGQTGRAILFKSANQGGADAGNPALGATWSVTKHVTFRYNIVMNAAVGFEFIAHQPTPSDNAGSNIPNYDSVRLQFIHVHDNLLWNMDELYGGGGGFFFSHEHGCKNVILDHNTCYNPNGSRWGGFSGRVGEGFVLTNNLAKGNDFALFGDGGSFGTNALNTFFSSYTADKNALVGLSESGQNVGQYPNTHFAPADWAACGFVDSTPDDVADFEIVSGPLLNAGTDGKSIGADIPAIIAATGWGGGAGDTTAPVISNISHGTPSATGTTVTWNTDEPATSQVLWGTSSGNLNNTTPATDSTADQTSHSVGLSGQSPSTQYFYKVRSQDSAGNVALSSEFSYTTAASSNPRSAIFDGSTDYGTATLPAGWTAKQSWTLEMRLHGMRWNFGTNQRIFYINSAFRLTVNASSTVVRFTSGRSGDTAEFLITLDNTWTDFYLRVRWDKSTGLYSLEAWKPDDTRVAATSATGSTADYNLAGLSMGIAAQPNGTEKTQVNIGFIRWRDELVAFNSAKPTDAPPSTTYNMQLEFENNSTDTAGNVTISEQGAWTYMDTP